MNLLRLSLLAPALLLAGCFNPTRPEIATIDAALPFDQAMTAVVTKDEFLGRIMRPGFDHTAEGLPESWTLERQEDTTSTVDHLMMLAGKWCTANGGQLESYPEIPVFQRGIATVIRLQENRPVTGRKAYNVICYRGREALAAAAIGRETWFLNAVRFRAAVRDAGASIIHLGPGR